MTVYAVVMKIALRDSDGKTKVLMLLVEPGGNPRGWDKVIIKRLQRCVYNAVFWSRIVEIQFLLFTNVNQHDLVGKALAKWVLAKPIRLSEVFIGTRSSVPLTILLLSFWLLAVFGWLVAASRALLVQVAGSRLIICRSAGPVFRCLAGLGGWLDGGFFFNNFC